MTPSYYYQNEKDQAWLEVCVPGMPGAGGGLTKLGVIFRVVTPGRRGAGRQASDTAVIKGKRYAVLSPLQEPRVVVPSVLELPRDLDTGGYGESLAELRQVLIASHDVVRDLITRTEEKV